MPSSCKAGRRHAARKKRVYVRAWCVRVRGVWRCGVWWMRVRTGSIRARSFMLAKTSYAYGEREMKKKVRITRATRRDAIV